MRSKQCANQGRPLSFPFFSVSMKGLVPTGTSNVATAAPIPGRDVSQSPSPPHIKTQLTTAALGGIMSRAAPFNCVRSVTLSLPVSSVSHLDSGVSGHQPLKAASKPGSFLRSAVRTVYMFTPLRQETLQGLSSCLVTGSLVFLEVAKAIIRGLPDTKIAEGPWCQSTPPHFSLSCTHVSLLSTSQQIRSLLGTEAMQPRATLLMCPFSLSPK